MRHLFIINKHAGKGGAWADIVSQLEKYKGDKSVELHYTTAKGDAATFSREYVKNSGEFVRVYACGGNLQAAKVAGINTTAIRISTFAIAGFLAGLCGFLMTSRVTIGQPTAAESYEMDAITACVVGGVSMTGGVGKPWGVVVGTLLITVIANGLDILGVSSHWQKIVKGLIIVLAVLIDVKGKSRKN